MTKANQYSLWHEVYETTGYDARNATYRNGTFIAEDGTDLLVLFKEKAKNGAGYELYSNRWLEYAKNGWKKENDLVLKIGFDSSGLYDIGPPIVRMYFKRLTEDYYKDLIVVSYNEIDANVELQSVGMVTA